MSQMKLITFGTIVSLMPDGQYSLQMELTETFRVYPNPGTGVFQVSGDNIREVEIKTFTGRVILRTKSSTVDLSHHPEGVYLFYISSGEETVVQKVIKK